MWSLQICPCQTWVTLVIWSYSCRRHNYLWSNLNQQLPSIYSELRSSGHIVSRGLAYSFYYYIAYYQLRWSWKMSEIYFLFLNKEHLSLLKLHLWTRSNLNLLVARELISYFFPSFFSLRKLFLTFLNYREINWNMKERKLREASLFNGRCLLFKYSTQKMQFVKGAFASISGRFDHCKSHYCHS